MAIECKVMVDRTPSDFQADFNDLRPKGFRPITLSAYAAGSLYAAVWVRRTGPDWSVWVNVSQQEFQQRFNDSVALGYMPTLLTAAGSAGAPRFGIMFEQHGGAIPNTRAGLVSGANSDRNAIQYAHLTGQNHGAIMISGACYGSAAQPLFAGVWASNPERVSWNAEGIAETQSEYEQRLAAQTSGFARPAFVSRSDFGTYLSVFRDDSVGAFIERHDLTRAELDAVLARYARFGYFPISLQGAGIAGAIRYAVVLAETDRPSALQWTASGPTANAAIDAAARELLRVSKVRGASLAVVSGKRLVYTRGYTLAEPGYPIVLPTTPFRIASVSKTYTAVAAQQLIESGNLALSDQLQNVLNLTPPPGKAIDAGFASITMQELLEHRTGLGWEPGPDEVLALFPAGLPVMPNEYLRVVATRPLADSTKPMAYSNLGYWLLGQVVAKKRGTTYFEAIRQSMLEPLGMTRTRLAASLLETTQPDEARYHRIGLQGQHLLGAGDFDLVDPADRAVAFDYDHSGKLDHLVLYRPGAGMLSIVKRNRAAFQTVFSTRTGIGGYDLGDPADQVFAFDYDHSSRLDHLVLYRPGTGTIWILKNTAGTFTQVYAQGAPGNGIGGYDLAEPTDRAFAFDYDHSGKLDHLVLYRPGAGTIWILKNTAGTFTRVYAQGAPGNGIGGYDLAEPTDRAFAFDYDRSGKLDHLVLYRPGTGTIWILKNTAGTFSRVYAQGAPGNGIGGYDLAEPTDRAFAFDYDNIGRLDHLVLYRPGAGTIWILKNSAGTFSPVVSIGAPGPGIAGYGLDDGRDLALSFDFEGTGHQSHLVLYRPGTGILRVLGHAGATFSVAYQQEGPRFGLWLARSVMHDDRHWVPGIYGDWNMPIVDASGGLSSAVVDQARLAAALSMTGDSPILKAASVTAMLQAAKDNLAAHPTASDQRAGYGFDSVSQNAGVWNAFKGGYIFSSQNGFDFSRGGVSILICFNGTSELVNGNPIIAAVNAADWSGEADLFPQYGMPSL